jgi:hypothetical protein
VITDFFQKHLKGDRGIWLIVAALTFISILAVTFFTAVMVTLCFTDLIADAVARRTVKRFADNMRDRNREAAGFPRRVA